MKIKKLLTIGAVAVLSLSSLSACEPQNSRTDEDIKAIVKDFMTENPEVILKSLEEGQKKIAEAENRKAEEAIQNLLPEIENDDINTPFIGPADAENVVVEFFDYNCGYCKRSIPTILEIQKKLPNTKVVFKEFPILSPASEAMARAALVVYLKHPKKYFEFHTALMEHSGEKTPAAVDKIAEDLGINIDFAKETAADEVAAIVKSNRMLGETIGIRGTPAFIINGKLIPGAIPFERIKEELEN